MKNKKAQIEFIALLGIVVVIFVIAYYAYTNGSIFPNPVPGGIGQEQNLIKDSIITSGKKGADLSILWLEQQGGFISADPSKSVVFTNTLTPYWEKCADTSMMPTLAQIKQRLETAVKNYINNSLQNKTNYFGRNVSLQLDKLSVTANILSNKIDFSVVLPAKVNGYDMQQPTTFSVPTKMGEIYDFGSKFVNDNAKNRSLEQFTISTIYFSDELPTSGVLTQCGQSIYASGNQISRGLYNSIAYTLANTMWWQPMFTTPATSSKTYAIESVGGKQYPQLNPHFYLPDGFTLGPSSPLSVTNNEFILVSLFATLPICVNAYDFNYSVNFPTVISVKDDLTGNRFNFAVFSEIKNLRPGDCSGFTTGTDTNVFSCNADIRVVDTSGNPIEGAFADFAGFPVGTSDSSGMIHGSTVCGSYQLSIGSEGYSFYKSANTTNPSNTYVLRKVPTTGFNLSYVDIDQDNGDVAAPDGTIEHYSYTRCGISPVTGSVVLNLSSGGNNYLISNLDAKNSVVNDCTSSCSECQLTGDPDKCRACIQACNSGIAHSSFVYASYLPGDLYNVDAQALEMTAWKPKGGFNYNYNIPEHNSTINVYVPMNQTANSINQRVHDTQRLKNICGMDPMVDNSTPAYNSFIRVGGCSCLQIRSVLAAVRSSIPGLDTTGLFWLSLKPGVLLPPRTTVDTYCNTINPQNCYLSCDKSGIITAVRQQGYRLDGC